MLLITYDPHWRAVEDLQLKLADYYMAHVERQITITMHVQWRFRLPHPGASPGV